MNLRLQKIMLLLLGMIFSTSSPANTIHWQSWDEQAFNFAKQQNKLIFLDVGTEWCSACNQMQHETYTDINVQNLLNEHFINIHVDAEAEPDIGERYGFWGWPALIFLSPQGEHVGFYRGYRPASDFTTVLNLLNSSHQNGQLEKAEIEVNLISAPSDDDFNKIVGLGNQMIDRFYDIENDSWGGARMADPYLLQQAWWRSHSSGQNHWHEKASRSSQLYLNLQDPVWGGVWFGTRSSKFDSDFIFEKRTEHQAGAISIFAQAYKNNNNTEWLEALNNIYSYLDSFMRSTEGGFYTSQEMHIYADNTDITPQAYFSLDDAQRRSIGMPEIDKTVYTDINAKLVIAFAQAYEATGDEKWRQRALSLLSYLHTFANQEGRYTQIISTDKTIERARTLPENNQSIVFLRSQAFAGLASLAAFQISGEQRWLEHAHANAETIISKLYEPVSGGLYGSSRNTMGPDGNKLNDQPLIDSAAAAEFFNRLSAYTYGEFDLLAKYNSKQYHQYAEEVLRAVAQPHRLRVQGNFIGQYVLALHQWQDEFTQVSVVCNDPLSKPCQSLHKTSLVQLTHPRRIVKMQKPGFYPDKGAANLFICDSRTCSSPIAYDDAKLIDKATNWFAMLDGKDLNEIHYNGTSTKLLSK